MGLLFLLPIDYALVKKYLYYMNRYVMKSIHLLQDKLSFEIKKSAQSKIDMIAEVEKIQSAVKQGQIVLHIHYIRPIVATEAFTQRTFKE